MFNVETGHDGIYGCPGRTMDRFSIDFYPKWTKLS